MPPVSLIRHHNFSRVALLQPETGTFEVITRELSGDPRRWVPDVPMHGLFDEPGELFVALYRNPDEPDELWLQLAASRWRVTDGVTSLFSPPDITATEEPQLESADVARTFTLLVNAERVFEHTYTLHDRERRLRNGMDPFPNWPDEEENYDLLLFVHRILGTKRWHTVLRPS